MRGTVKTRWKFFRHRLEWWACRFLEIIIPSLSRRTITGFAQFLGAAVFTFDRKGRRVALANLDAVFRSDLDKIQKKDIARRSYQNFARTMLDLFWAQRVTKDNFLAFTSISGFEEILQRARTEKRGIAFICAHQGNWEWAALAFAHLGGHANIVAQDFKNATLTSLFARLRRHGKHTLISQDRAMLRLLKCVLRGENTALLADLTLDPSEGSVVLRAFGPNPLEISATRLHSILALRGNALLVPVVTDRLTDGRISVTALAPIETTPEMAARKIAQATWDVFEKIILPKPELWLWPYKHFRFRPAHTERAYPFYSSTNSKFEELRMEPLI